MTRVALRPLEAADRSRFLALVEASRALHHPFVAPPSTEEAFDAQLARVGETYRAYVIERADDGDLAGAFNVSQIFMRAFRSAYLGFYAFAPSAGQGLMREGLALVVTEAFEGLGLHRLEANIRPENERSIRLVRGAGFEREGYSKDYLFLDGAWRDHERWAVREELWPRSERA